MLPVSDKEVAGPANAPGVPLYAQEMRHRAERELVLDYLTSSSTLLQTAYTIYEASQELPKEDLEREPAYMQRNLNRTRVRFELRLKNFF